MRMIVTLLSVLIAGILSFTTAQTPLPSTDELVAQIPGLANIPGFVDFNTSSVDTEKIQKKIEEKCTKNGGPTAFETAKSGPKHLQDCLQSLVNVTALQEEMETAKPQGELDTVFKKYCDRVPRLEKCVHNVTDTIAPCLESDEKDSIKIFHNITSSLLKFICHNEGDRIAMFIAAGGVDCVKSKQKDIEDCANQTFAKYIPAVQSASQDLSSLPQLVITLKECTDMEKFRTCAVPVLETCPDPTPGNVMDSLFNFVKRVTPCENLLKERSSAVTGNNTGSGSDGSINIVNLLLVTVAMVMSLRFV